MIERKSKTYSIDDAPESTGEVDEMAVEATPAGETATLSLEMLGGQTVAPGDVISLEVAEVSDEDGTVTVRYNHPKKKVGGIDKAMAAFNEGP